LDLVDPSGRHSTAAFPEEFDDVYDFEFSPDGAQALVGFGNVGCDYPGDSGAVYLVPLSGSAPRRLTPKDHIALKGHFSPDGQQVAYTDFTNGGSPSVFIVGVNGGKAMPLVAPDQQGDDEVLDWR
jgi:Tol biopolymer transport system component